MISNHGNVFCLQTWCYTHRNGRSLVRMANLMPETADPQQEEKYVSYFQRQQNDQQNEIYSIVFPMADGHIPSIHMFIN